MDELQQLPYIIAVDFDGTLCTDCHPNIGKPNWEMIDFLLWARTEGAKLILWTCRQGKTLDQAVTWCRGHGLVFDQVNANLPEIVEIYHEESRKVYADLYIDDHAYGADSIGLPYSE